MPLIDVAIELLDARIPQSSSNPMIKELLGNKPRVIALNKYDLAEKALAEEWTVYYQKNGLPVVMVDSLSGQGHKELLRLVENTASAKIDKLRAKGIRHRVVRAMILGIPNVGKSSLINRFLGNAAARTGGKPGITRGQQWLKVSKSIELLDTPGILWPKLDNQDGAFKLAVTGAVKDDVYDREKVTLALISLLRKEYGARLVERYNLKEPLPQDEWEILSLIGAKRGCLKNGGIVDTEKAGKIVFTEFRTGKLGAFTLDKPPM